MSFKLRILAIIIPSVFLLDQLTKRLVVAFIPQGSFIPILPGLFNLVHTRNRGAAFGFMAHLPDGIRLPFFFVISGVSLLLITLYFFRMKDERRGIFIGLALILGGACGNIWDRVFLGEVIDFLSFHWYDRTVAWRLAGYRLQFRLEWPAFNVADMAISLSVIWLMCLMVFHKDSKESGENKP